MMHANQVRFPLSGWSAALAAAAVLCLAASHYADEPSLPARLPVIEFARLDPPREPNGPEPLPDPTEYAPPVIDWDASPNIKSDALERVWIDPQGPLEWRGNWAWLLSAQPWKVDLLPHGLIYHSYLAGGRESRFGSVIAWQEGHGWVWDIALGGRVGLIRYGPADSVGPAGIQLDAEGAAFPRLDLENDRDLAAADFRFGVPLTFGNSQWAWKAAYYHLSSHLGDELIVRMPGISRINYVRDAMVVGTSFSAIPAIRLYAEAGYAFNTSGGSQPWEFQGGAEWMPLGLDWKGPVPFLAVNGRIREEVGYGGNLIAQAGLAWRSHSGESLFRLGAHYFNGKSDQYEFFREFEEQIGFGLWYDY
jgi:hypothetical protein